MSEWMEIRLGDLITTNQNTVNKDYPFKYIKYLDTGSITEGKIAKYQDYRIIEAPSRAKRLVKENDIIYSSVRPVHRHYGFIIDPPENLVVSTGFVVITCNEDDLNPKYLYYYLSADETVEILHSIAEGSTSTYPSLKPNDIESLEITIPNDVSEQKNIAELLSSLDDKIDLLNRQNKTLEQMAETLFRQCFVEDVEENWAFDELKNHVDVIDNRGKTPPNSKDKTPYPLIEVNALGNENRLVDYSVIKKYVDKDTFENWFRNKPKKYDTLLSTVGSIGAISMYLLEIGNVAQNVIGLTAKGISSLYLYQFLKYRTDEILLLDIGGVQPSIKVPHLLSLEVPIPSVRLQNEFDTEIVEFMSKMEINYSQICTLKQLRDTLLPKLISGEIRIASNG